MLKPKQWHARAKILDPSARNRVKHHLGLVGQIRFFRQEPLVKHRDRVMLLPIEARYLIELHMYLCNLET
jgi:hypothetical protein